MENLLGCLFLFVLFIFIFFFTKKHFYSRNFLLTAFIVRSLLVILTEYDLILLPDNLGDATKFEFTAREFSRNEGLLILKDFFKSDSLLISRIISIFYTVFGESVIVAKGISVALGTVSVYLTYFLVKLLWDRNSAKKAAWLVALFPTLILYSTIILREPYIVFFLLIGLIFIVKFIKKHSLISFLIIISNFYIISLFHGPAAVGIFIFFLYLMFFIVIKQIIVLAYKLKVNINKFVYIIPLSIVLYLILNNNLVIPYVGSFEVLKNFNLVILKLNNYMTGTASYPSWLIINNVNELPLKGIIKLFYFMYSPFIWDLKSFYQIFGVLDSLLYLLLSIYLIRNWHAIWENPVTRVIVLMFISYIIVYGISVGNFGTAIRHRSKFVIILIVLVAPKIHKFIFSTKKKKIYKR